MSAPVDVLAVMAETFDTAAKAIPYRAGLSVDFTEARAAVAELLALVGAMVETDRLVSREDIATLFWPQFVVEAKKSLARMSGSQA